MYEMLTLVPGLASIIDTSSAHVSTSTLSNLTILSPCFNPAFIEGELVLSSTDSPISAISSVGIFTPFVESIANRINQAVKKLTKIPEIAI